jgi:hypothetical protein
MKISPVGAPVVPCGQTGGRTDMTNVITTFRNFANTPTKNYLTKSNSHVTNFFVCYILIFCGPGSSVGIATDYGLDGSGIESQWVGEIFRTCPDRPWGPPSLLYNGYRVLLGGKVRPERDADHSPPSSAEVFEE